jgi:hypothetical protein
LARRRTRLALYATLIGGLTAPPISSAVASTGQGGDVTAREAVAVEHDGAANVVSPAPRLQLTDGTRASPTLRSVGRQRFKAVSTVAQGDIAADVRHGFSFDTARGSRVTVTPVGVDRAATSGVVANGDSVVYANTDPATDTIVRPTIDGIETFTQIRAGYGPEAFSWKVALAGGEHLRVDVDGGASVINSDGMAVTKVAAPWARAADGSRVQTWFSVTGDVLTLHVMHRGAGHAYPIVADPHWGWVHVVELMDAARTRSVIDLLRAGRDAAAIVGVIFGVVSGGASMVIANGLAAIGFGRVAENLGDALDRSRGRGVRIDAGLRCRNVPYAPDPCWPAVWIRAR